jgi:hypothetical protein
VREIRPLRVNAAGAGNGALADFRNYRASPPTLPPITMVVPLCLLDRRRNLSVVRAVSQGARERFARENSYFDTAWTRNLVKGPLPAIKDPRPHGEVAPAPFRLSVAPSERSVGTKLNQG